MKSNIAIQVIGSSKRIARNRLKRSRLKLKSFKVIDNKSEINPDFTKEFISENKYDDLKILYDES
jgi:ribosomal protein L20A (L18A)